MTEQMKALSNYQPPIPERTFNQAMRELNEFRQQWAAQHARPTEIVRTTQKKAKKR